MVRTDNDVEIAVEGTEGMEQENTEINEKTFDHSWMASKDNIRNQSGVQQIISGNLPNTENYQKEKLPWIRFYNLNWEKYF